MSDQWHVHRDSQEFGPYSSAQLEELARAGRLAPTDRLFDGATQAWYAAGEIEGLFAPAPAPGAETTASVAEEPSQPARPNRGRGRGKTSLPYWIGPMAGAGVLGLLTVAALFSGRSGPSDASRPAAKRPPENRTERPPGATDPADAPPEAPDFSGVDYAVDFSDLDYSRGPRGEKLEQRREEDDDGFVTTFQEYRSGRDRWLRQGLEIVFYPGGKKKEEGYFWAGKRHGTYARWYENGRLELKGAFMNGGKHGRFVSYFPSGKLQEDAYWLWGKPHGRALTWHPTGEKKSEGYRVSGKAEGPFQAWRPDGTLETEGRFKDGKEEGVWINRNADGSPSRSRPYRAGKLHGTEKEFYPPPRSKQVRVEKTYRDGRLVSEKVYGRGGEVVESKKR